MSFLQDFDQRRTYEQIVKFTYNMLSRSLSKTDHFTLALHILKEAYPELVPQKVIAISTMKLI